MITDALASGLLVMAEFVVGLLPASSTLDLEPFGGAIAQFRAFNEALPVVETLAMAGGLLTIISGIFLYRVIVTLYHMIPAKFT